MSIRAAALILLLAIVPAHAAKKASSQTKSTQATPEIDLGLRDLLTRSDIAGSRDHAEKALAARPRDPDALFLLMEASTLQADTASELGAALRLCESGRFAADDPRIEVASAHILDLAANTAHFRPAIGRIQQMLRSGSACENNLRAALIAAAMDGAPGLSPSQLAHDAGLLTEWKIAGPFGKYRNVDFDNKWPPERDGRLSLIGNANASERVSFLDGTFRLPYYFSREGVYYASTQFTERFPGERILRLESPGTLQVWIDGVPVLTKDDRFRATPEVVATTVRLHAGTHRLLAKFISTAVPFRVAIVPQRRHLEVRRRITGQPELLAFANAENSYWKGNYEPSIAELEKIRTRQPQPSVAVEFLLARAWHQQEENSAQEDQFLASSARSSPDAVVAHYALANRAYDSARLDEAIRELRSVLDSRPDYTPAVELSARLSSENNWSVEAKRAYTSLARLHPDCDNLRRAHKFNISKYDINGAKAVEAQLGTCAPASLDLAEVLSAAGDHRSAAAAANRVVMEYPLDRDARSMLARELFLDGNDSAAHVATEQLALIAPNSTSDLSSAGSAVSDAVREQPFYQRFHYDGIAIARDSSLPETVSSSTIRLLDQRLVRVEADGSLSVYVHRLTRIVSRAAIQQYGEVTLPSDSSLLELRTIQPDGAVAEPEFEPNKKTVSMPGLSPGSVIDIEYLTHLDSESIRRNRDEFTFTFGSFQMPVLRSEFGLLAPSRHGLIRAIAKPGVPPPAVSDVEGEHIELWQSQYLPRAKQESDVPPGGGLPTVILVSSPASDWRGIQSTYRDVLIDAVRIGPQVEKAATAFNQVSEEDRARKMYLFVLDNVRNDGGSFDTDDLSGAEDTLSGNSGSPTAALIALARARGLEADLVLARSVASSPADTPTLNSYDRPLVRLTLRSTAGAVRSVLVDVEDGNLPFGALPADLRLDNALLVPTQESGASSDPIIALHPERNDIVSFTRGDIRVTDSGDIQADIEIQYSDRLSADMRATPAGSNAQTLLNRIAQKVFKSASEISGEVTNLTDPDQPLSAHVRFFVPHFWNLLGEVSPDISHLLPALDLKAKYAGSTERHLPLYLDSPSMETISFRVHLPAGFHVSDVAPSVDLNTSFGSFQMNVREVADGLEIERKTSIPVQIVEPSEYRNFAGFTEKIEAAEHTQATLLRENATAAHQH